MQITLTNFRCWENCSFDFGDKGLVLISGSSGKGKSTIFQGIAFVLFGTGTKLQTYGKKSCKVILKFDNMCITRTKCPNRLILTIENSTSEGRYEYEDDVAQEIINRKFGTFFNTVSYIQQDSFGSFIYLSPAEKLEFIEKFAFGNCDLKGIKEKTKNLIKERTLTLTNVQSKLEYSKTIIQTVPVNVPFPEEITPSLKEKSWESLSEKSRGIVIKNIETRISNHSKKIDLYKEKYSNITKILSEILVKEKELEIKKNQLGKIEKNLLLYKDEIIDLKYIGDDALQELREKLKQVQQKRELVNLQRKYKQDSERYEQLQKDEDEQYKLKIIRLEGELWKKYSKDECLKIVNKLRAYQTKQSKKNDLQEDLLKYDISGIDLDKSKKELDELNGNISVLSSYVCPNCNSRLKLRDNKLELLPIGYVETTHSLKELMKKRDMLEKKRSSDKTILDKNSLITSQLQELETKEPLDVDEKWLKKGDDIQKYYLLHLGKERELTNVKEEYAMGKLSTTLSSLKISLTKQQSELKRLEESARRVEGRTTHENEDDLNREIQEQLSLKNQITEKNRVKTKLYEEKYQITQEISKIVIEEDSEMIKKRKEKIEKFLKKEEINKREEEEIKKKLEKYLTYEQELKKYTEWCESIEKLEEDEKGCRDRLSAVNTLKEKILEAEAISMETVINSINTHAQLYLEKFFDQSISAFIQSFKNVKSKINSEKPQINLAIEYREVECDFSTLSGGERSRVSLAFTLSLNEIFNCPIILLDESLASLDQENVNRVTHCIREMYKGQMVIFICHNVISGFFDKVISLE